MNSSHDTGLHADCNFPACDKPAVTDTGMCESHRAVAISRTGSWLEAS